MTSKEIANSYDQRIHYLQQEIKRLQDSKKGQTAKSAKESIDYQIKNIRQTIEREKLNKQNAVNAAKKNEADEKERQREANKREKEREKRRKEEEKARLKEEKDRDKERKDEERARLKEESQRERERQREAKQASKSSGRSSSYSSENSNSYSSESSSSYSSGSSSSYSSESSNNYSSHDDSSSNYSRKSKRRSIEDQEDDLIELFEEKVEKAESKLHDKYVNKPIPTDAAEFIKECKYWKAESTKKHAPDPELIDFIKKARKLVNDDEFMEEYEEDAEIMSDVVEARLMELYHHAKEHKELLANAEVREIFKKSLEDDEKESKGNKIALYATLLSIVGTIIAWFCISGFWACLGLIALEALVLFIIVAWWTLFS